MNVSDALMLKFASYKNGLSATILTKSRDRYSDKELALLFSRLESGD